MLEYRILGPLEVADDGRALPLGRGRERALLAALLVRANEVVSTDRLMEVLWAERRPPTAAKALQGHVSQLRKLLGEERLVTRAPGYLLRLNGDELDARRFARLLEQGRQELAAGRAAAARETFERALDLWRGEPLAEFVYEEFARGEIERLEELRLSALEERAEADLALGRQTTVVPELERLVSQHPLRERLRWLLMLALYRSGRQAEALASYQQARHALAEELGIEPGEELQELNRGILARDPALAPAPRAAMSPPTMPARRAPPRRRTLALAAVGMALLAAAAAVGLIRDTGDAALTFLAPNTLGVVDPATNRLVAAIPVGARPVRVAVGEGAAWVGNGDDLTIMRVDPETHAVVSTIGVGAEVADITVGDGSVWVANGNDERITRIDPGDNVSAQRIDLSVPGAVMPRVVFSLAVAGGALWGATFDEGVLRIDPRSGAVVSVAPGASAVAVGEGAVWAGLVDRVARIDPRTNAIRTTKLATYPEHVAVGAAAVWVLVSGATHPGASGSPASLWRLDPVDVTVTGTFSAGVDAVDVAVGAGSVWVASGAARAIRRIDARTGDLVAIIPLGAPPTSLAYGEGVLWVTVTGRD